MLCVSAPLSRCRPAAIAALRWSHRSMLGTAMLIAAALWGLAASTAAAQGTNGRFPDPRSGPEVERWLLDAGVPLGAMGPAWPIHERALAEAARLRDGEIEAWLRSEPPPGHHLQGGGEPGQAAAQIAAGIADLRQRLDRQRRLQRRVGELEDRFWIETAAALGLSDEVAAELRERGARSRLRGIARRTALHLGLGPEASIFDSSAIAERIGLAGNAAAALRRELAGHDAALWRLLETAAELDATEELRNLEMNQRFQEVGERTRVAIEAETATAMAEGRMPDLDSVHAAHHAEAMREHDAAQRQRSEVVAAIQRQNMATARALWGRLDLEQRNGIVSLLGVPDGGLDEFWPLLAEQRRRGQISAADAERVDAIKQTFLERRTELALELGALRESGATEFEIGEDGHPVAPPGMARMHEIYGELYGTAPMDAMRSLGEIVDLRPVMIAAAEKQGISAAQAEAMADGAIAWMNATEGEEDPFGSPEAHAAMARHMIAVYLPLAAQPAFDEAALWAQVLDDLGVPATLHGAADTLLEESLEAYAALRERFRAAIEATLPDGQEREGVVAVGPPMPSGDLIDGTLREAMAIDAALLAAVGALGAAEAAERAQLWVDWRGADLAAKASEVRGRSADGGGPFNLAGPTAPWEGGYAGVDAVEALRAVAPEALRTAALREAVAAHLARLRPQQERYWDRLWRSLVQQRALEQRMWGPGAFDPLDQQDPMAAHERRMALYEEHQAIGRRRVEERSQLQRAVRRELETIEAALPAGLRRSFHAAVRQAAWPGVVTAMPGIDAMNRAEAIAIEAGDDAGIVEVSLLFERYRERSEALFGVLDELAREGDRAPRGGAPGDEPDPAAIRRLVRTTQVLAFRHRELDFEAVRSMRALLGPAHAGGFAWQEPPPNAAAAMWID